MNPHDACELARNMSGIEDNYKDVAIDVSNVAVELMPPLPANFEIPPQEAEGATTACWKWWMPTSSS